MENVDLFLLLKRPFSIAATQCFVDALGRLLSYCEVQNASNYHGKVGVV